MAFNHCAATWIVYKFTYKFQVKYKHKSKRCCEKLSKPNEYTLF